MKLPEHTNPKKNNNLCKGNTGNHQSKRNQPKKKNGLEIAFAPYNFVPLPNEVLCYTSFVEQDKFSGNSGQIKCKLTTKSPLYIGCGMTPQDFKDANDDDDRDPNFYYINDRNEPVIPGSSLRGLIRSIVEIIGYCKVQFVSDDKLVYRGVGDTSSIGDAYRHKMCGSANTLQYPLKTLRGGYLHKEGYKHYIIPACSDNGESFVHIEGNLLGKIKKPTFKAWIKPPDHRDVSIRSGRPDLNLALVSDKDHIKLKEPMDKKDFREVTVVHTSGLGNKHMHCAIYEKEGMDKKIEIPDDVWDLFKDDQQKSQVSDKQYYHNVENEGDPLFYLVDDEGKLIFLGPTMMFRIPYENSILDYIPEEIRSPDGYDLAEMIFGVASDSNDKTRENNFSGRVFFTDARYESRSKKSMWFEEKPYYLPILSSPKPTTFQHYLVQDKRRRHDPNNKMTFAHYSTPVSETVIRGTKMYWNIDGLSKEDIIEKNVDEEDTQHTKVRPLNTGVTFGFTIKFENLQDHELGGLLWALSLPVDGKYRHSLGMGKPFGMGMVLIEPELCLSSREERYSSLFGSNEADSTEYKKDEYFIRSFEQMILKFLGSPEKKLCNVPRIEMMLKMLEFPGQKTKYMTIEPDNQFKNRPVLPDPLHINTK